VFSALRDVFRLPDLKSKILFVLGILFVFRLGAHIPTPGVGREGDGKLVRTGWGSRFVRPFCWRCASSIQHICSRSDPLYKCKHRYAAFGLLWCLPLKKMQKEGEEGRRKLPSTPEYWPYCLPPFRQWAWYCGSRA